ncbi:MAG: leucyl/phenylalanyl-tRNA--protein transferase [Saprospiraceae bacterium]|nr:leucyl/phenylalanyl-tRNA--protein transferase [Saprospiraceae bacterium]
MIPCEYILHEKNYFLPELGSGLVNELLFIGGSLQFEEILVRYSNGMFPWYHADEPVMWFGPVPRLVLYPEKLKISKSLSLLIKKNIFQYSIDWAFLDVMLQCKTVHRSGQSGGSWIHEDIIHAYLELHNKGIAHSVEIWNNEQLVGGLYGLGIGKMFCGESMFFKESNASKIALTGLCIELLNRNYEFIDCQQDTPHLTSMGATLLSLDSFKELLKKNKNNRIEGSSWTKAPGPIHASDLQLFS